MVGRILQVCTFALFTSLLASIAGSSDLAIPRAVDVNADPEIVEVHIEAAETQVEYFPGVWTDVWAYNGTVPGPQIDLVVGQRLIMHFTNSLPVPTTVHFHGVETPAHMDGSNISQEAIPPGGTFIYEWYALTASTFWYHPHLDTNVGIEMGLYGSIVVRDEGENLHLRVPRDREHVLFVDDILLTEDGQVAPFATDLTNEMDPLERAEEILTSREGTRFLVNGKNLPTLNAEIGRPVRLRFINSASGSAMRLSLPRHLMYRIGGDAGLLNETLTLQPINQVWDSFLGRFISNPDPARGVLLTPGERADIIVTPTGRCGDVLNLEWHDIFRGRHTTFFKREDIGGGIGIGHPTDDGKKPPRDILRIELTCENTLPWFWWLDPVLRQDPYNWGFIPWIQPALRPTEPITVPPQAEPLVIVFGHGPPMPNGNVMMFNTVKNSAGLYDDVEAKLAEAEDPGNVGPIPGAIMPPMYGPVPFPMLSPDDAPTATFGETRFWYLVNFSGGDHGFHTHGFFFQALETIKVDLDRDTADERVRRQLHAAEFKDTINVPGRPDGGHLSNLGRSFTIMKLAVRFDDSHRPSLLQRSEEDVVAFGKVPITLDPLDPSEGFSGGWMTHCHNLEHPATGMMTFYNLLPVDQSLLWRRSARRAIPSRRPDSAPQDR